MFSKATESCLIVCQAILLNSEDLGILIITDLSLNEKLNFPEMSYVSFGSLVLLLENV